MNHIKKIGVSFMIVLTFLFIIPEKTNAQYVDVSNAIKEYGLDTLAYQIANQVIKKISAQTVNWINSGFEGKPAFLEDPDRFFLDLADNTAGDFFSKTNLNGLCTPFKAQVRLALVKNYLSDNNNNYTCTLSKVKDNYDAFMQDFSKGGWEGWFEITQNDSNNPYGAYLQAQSSLLQQESIQNNKYVQQLEQGRGFLSFEQCPDSGVVTQKMIDDNKALIASGALKPENNAVEGKKVGDCLVKKQTVTPGSLIQSQLNERLASPGHRLEAADEIDEILGALLNQFTNAVVGGIGKGLRGLTKSSGGNPSTYDDLVNSPAEDVGKGDNGADVSPVVTCIEDPVTHVTLCKAEVVNRNLSACLNTGTGHGNDPDPVFPINPNNIVYEITNISRWSQNGTLASVTADNEMIHFAHDRYPSNWAPFDVAKEPNDPAFSSPWILVWRKNPAPIVIPDSLKVELRKLVEMMNTESVRADSLNSDNTLIQSGGKYYCGNLINGASTNCTRYRQWKAFIEEAVGLEPVFRGQRDLKGIIDEIAIIQKTAPSNALARMSTVLNDLSNKNTSFLQFLTDTIGNDADSPVYKASDYIDEVKSANALLDAINQAIPVITDLINPPPEGSGRWHAVPFTYLTVGHPNEREVDYAFCGGIGGARTLPDFLPTAGDTYGFMLSTPSRDTTVVTNPANVRQKTNIVNYKWPTGIIRPKKSGELPLPVPGGQCFSPADADTKHGNHQGEVSAAKDELASQGMTWDPNSPSFECDRYQITKRAVQLIGNGAILYPKTTGTQCEGYSVDTIAFADGYTYDVLNGNAADGAGPAWNSSTCLDQAQ